MLGRLFAEPDIRRHLLSDEGEDVVDVVRKHWVSYSKATLVGVVGLGLLIAAGFATMPVAWVPILAGFLALLYAAYLAVATSQDCFVITNMRVFRLYGVFDRTLATMPLIRILDITVDKPLTGRVLGYGHFIFESAAQARGLREIKYVARPDERDLEIQRVIARAGLRGPGVR